MVSQQGQDENYQEEPGIDLTLPKSHVPPSNYTSNQIKAQVERNKGTKTSGIDSMIPIPHNAHTYNAMNIIIVAEGDLDGNEMEEPNNIQQRVTGGGVFVSCYA